MMENFFEDYERRKAEAGAFAWRDEKPVRGWMDVAKMPATMVNAVPYQLAGAPVDLLTAIANLGLAGRGTFSRWLGGKPEDMPALLSDVPLGSEWWLQKARQGPFPVDNPIPESPVARGIWAAGNTAANAILTGRMMGGPGTALGPSVAREAAQTGAFGAASGGLAQAASEMSDRPETAILASLLPQTMGAAGNLMFRPSAPRTPERQAAVEYAKANNIPLTRGQETGGPVTNLFEKLLAAMPGSGGTYAKQQTVVDKKTNALVESLTQGGAGKQIREFGANKNIDLDQTFFDEMRAIKQSFSGLPDVDVPGGPMTTINQFTGKPNPAYGQVADNPRIRAQLAKQGIPEIVGNKYTPGDAMPLIGNKGDYNNYWALRSLYSAESVTGKSPKKDAYAAIRNALDDAAMRSLERQGFDPKKLEELRRTVGVEKVLQKGMEVSPDGTVSYDPARIGSEIARRDKNYGQNWSNWLGSSEDELRQLGNFGNEIRPVKTSGTVENRIAAEAGRGMGIGVGLNNINPWQIAGSVGSYLTGIPWMVNKVMQHRPRMLSPYEDAAKLQSLSTIASEEQRKRLLDMGLVGPTY